MERKLVIIPDEAKIVRAMFTCYLELHSVHLLQRGLEEQGVRTRARALKGGQISGGCLLGRGAISHMLKNPLYAGKIRYKDELHTGQHEAIVDEETFDAVQVLLAQYSPGEAARSKRPTGALLQGILFDAKGERLIPTHANKRGVRYHYYTSAKRLKSAADDPDGLRVPAGDLDRLVINAVAERLRDHECVSKWAEEHSPVDRAKILGGCSEIAKCISSEDSTVASKHFELIQKVELSKVAMGIRMSSIKIFNALGIGKPSNAQDESADERDAFLNIEINSHLLRCGKQVKLVLGASSDEPQKANEKMVEMIAKAKRWYEGLTSGKYPTLRAISNEENLDKSYVRRLLSLAFLAPDIVERILTGDHAATLTPERLRKACPLPMRWEDQRAMLID